MIKQIQLRGLSRDPSDRLTEDGGVADSMNVQLDHDELAPTPEVHDVSIGAPASFKALYIHKQNAYTNYIGRDGTSLFAMVEGAQSTAIIAALDTAEDPTGITSIGNILVWTTASGTHYALFRDGAYISLGDSVPEPKVTFLTTYGGDEVREIMSADSISLNQFLGLPETNTNPMTVWSTIRKYADDSASSYHNFASQLYAAINETLWSQVDAARVNLRGNKTFDAPVLARYALRLYDGNYIYVSAPVLLCGSNEHDYVRVLFNYDGAFAFKWRLYMLNTFAARVRVDFGSGGSWGDLIESVDIFISPDIQVPKYGAKIRGAYDNGTNLIGTTNHDAGFEMEGVSDYAWLYSSTTANRYKEDFETAMLEKGNFYRIASIPAFTQEYWEEDLKPYSNDDLVVLPRLSEGEAHQTSGLGGVGSYNERLILTGEKVTLSRGNQRPDAIISISSSSATQNVSAFFYVRAADGTTRIVRGYDTLNIVDKERARAYIVYPDPRCYQAVYYVHNGSSYTKVVIPMKEHPRINAAYGFWGLGLRLDESSGSGDTRTISTVTAIAETENRTYTLDNRMYLSETQNPFFFPLGQRVSFSSSIVAAMPITIPLSTGQFGQFQLYVFTEDGIWAETITDEGTISSTHPVSRDTALPGTVCQLDQGIIFASEKGVMLLTGSEVSNISPHMPTERYVVGEGGALLPDLGDWQGLLVTDDAPFTSYIPGARFVYDYPGQRVLMFNASYDYAYIYKLDTQTWHKQKLPSGKTIASPLNAYPDALVTMRSAGSYSVVDFTTRFDVSEHPERLAVVVTRTFDLDLPDVRKEIRNVRIRGEFPMGSSAQYVLMGSMDGRYFKQLTSLRNGSWKFYKIALLLKLRPSARVSWIDIEYDERFRNKLR